MPQAPPGEYPTGNTLQRFEIGTWKSEIVWEGYGPYWVDGRSFTNWGQIRYHNGKFMHDWVPGLIIDP